ncbi:MAG: SPBc2 prophage-derived aminoglycoside N(3')-acetyltransferase-like protein YokD [Smithella sp. PtaU1.Bin162]|nr:MAG: SPBc2 prophage-derived aminoglycoside N(3')-acetyltransferase-like protein YokD [Smithella sp. PtaU1.Bin162]
MKSELRKNKSSAVKQLLKDFEKLGIKKGSRVFIHSSFKSLGLSKDISPEDVVGILKKVVGPSGTIGMPTFTYSFSEDKRFNRENSPSATGILTEAFRKSEGVFRSISPSHSVAFWGCGAEYFAHLRYGITPYNIRSPFGKLYEHDFTIVMLGCGLMPNSTLHAIEDWADLPYCKNSVSTCYSAYSGTRDTGLPYPKMPLGHRDFYKEKSKYVSLMMRHGSITSGKVADATVYCMKVRELVDICMKELDKHPDLFLCDDPGCISCHHNRLGLDEWKRRGGSGWEQVWIGAAKTCITPGVGTYANHGWSVGTPCEEVHDDIYCRVIVFKNKAEYSALVSLEALLIEADLAGVYKKAVHEKTKIKPENIIICVTHTHYGPSFGTQRLYPEVQDESYSNFLSQKISGCVYDAMKNMEPVSVAFAIHNVDIGNINRRVRMPDGSYMFYANNSLSPKPNGKVSREFAMVFFRNFQGDVKAGIAEYACHPIFFPPATAEISGDYPGVLSATVEKEQGNNAVITFVQGACGDQMPQHYGEGYKGALTAGKKLAYAFLSEAIDARYKPLKSVIVKTKMHKIANAGKNVVTIIQALVMNDIVFAFGSSELFYGLVERFRKKLGSKRAILAGYIDSLSYLPEKKDFEYPTYETKLCEKVIKAKPGIGEEIVDACADMVKNAEKRIR